MSTNNSPNSTFKIHPSSLVPVYHWRGARPLLLDLETDQSGSLLSLVLTREGDCRLLPLAWYGEEVCEEDCIFPGEPLYEERIEQETMHLILQELKNDGWHVSGKLHCHFAGIATDPHFWQSLHPFILHPSS